MMTERCTLCLNVRRLHRNGCPPALSIEGLLRDEEREEQLKAILPKLNHGLPIMAEAFERAGFPGVAPEEEKKRVFTETQRAVATGDIDAISQAATEALARELSRPGVAPEEPK